MSLECSLSFESDLSCSEAEMDYAVAFSKTTSRVFVRRVVRCVLQSFPMQHTVSWPFVGETANCMKAHLVGGYLRFNIADSTTETGGDRASKAISEVLKLMQQHSKRMLLDPKSPTQKGAWYMKAQRHNKIVPQSPMPT